MNRNLRQAPYTPNIRGPKPGWAPSNEEKYDRFMKTLLHGTDWTAGLKYFALYWLGFREEGRQLWSPVFENGSGRCAEAHLMDHLRLQLTVLSPGRLATVTIMQNSSPCWGCSARYEEGLRDLITDSGVVVTVVFSSFHRIRRPSCQWNYRCRSHVNALDLDHHVQNKNGLKRMSDAGIEVRTTGFQDWKTLRQTLQLPDNLVEQFYNESLRKQEDDKLKGDLEFLLGD